MSEQRISDKGLEVFLALVIDGTNFQDLALDLRDARAEIKRREQRYLNINGKQVDAIQRLRTALKFYAEGRSDGGAHARIFLNPGKVFLAETGGECIDAIECRESDIDECAGPHGPEGVT